MSWAGVEAGAKIFVGLMPARREAAEAASVAQSIAATSCAAERLQDLRVFVLQLPVRFGNKMRWNEADRIALPRGAGRII